MRLKNTVQKYLIPTFILFVAAGVYVAQKITAQSTTDGRSLSVCEFENLTCQLYSSDEPIVARFSRAPQAEEEISVRFSLAPEYQIESVWIEGTNMYMGKIPVLVEETQPGEWSGWFMLGSCSEPQMHWQMLLNLKGEVDPKILIFTTDTHS